MASSCRMLLLTLATSEGMMCACGPGHRPLAALALGRCAFPMTGRLGPVFLSASRDAGAHPRRQQNTENKRSPWQGAEAFFPGPPGHSEFCVNVYARIPKAGAWFECDGNPAPLSPLLGPAVTLCTIGTCPFGHLMGIRVPSADVRPRRKTRLRKQRSSRGWAKNRRRLRSS